MRYLFAVLLALLPCSGACESLSESISSVIGSLDIAVLEQNPTVESALAATGGFRETLSALHPVLKEACSYAPGIRILRQEPWEALCSFIISQNNNIPRIKGIIERLCGLSGQPILCGAETVYAFPTAEQLAACTPEDLVPVRAGFRAKYLLDAARRVSTGQLDLNALYTASLEDARSALMTIHGVGPKVADCVLLYGLHHTCCFPMDVWMKRAVQLLPGISPESLGCTAGIAQQYLFHYARMHPELFR